LTLLFARPFGQDIFIQVPGRETAPPGDVFLDRGWMPLFTWQECSIPRWIEVLDALLTQDPNRSSWAIASLDKGQLTLWRTTSRTTWMA